MLKIISGRLKNRIVPVLPKAKFKPSTTRTREAIFSIINSWQFEQRLENSNVLDVFSGSGSLGLEALSRGAKFVSFIDSSLEQINFLKNYVHKIGEEASVGFVHANAERLPYANRLYDIILMDPPYFENLSAAALKSLKKNNWLADSAIIILEVATREDVELPQGYEQVDVRIYGNNKLVFLKYGKN